MAITLLSIAIVLLFQAALADGQPRNRFHWLTNWALWCHDKLAPNGFWQSRWGPLVLAAPFFLLLLLLQHWLESRWFGILGFGLGLFFLYCSLGPRNLAEDLQQLIHAHLPEQRVTAQANFGVSDASARHSTQLIEPIFQAANQRKFAPLFWFVVFGGAGAVAYRIIQQLAYEPEFQHALPTRLIHSAKHVEAALAWIPAQLMCAALALASDFDAVARAWQTHHDRHGRGIFDVDLGFLSETAKACIDVDDVDDIEAQQIHDDNAPLHHASQLLGRITIAWLLGISIIVFAQYLS